MSKNSLDLFLTDYYKILKILYENQVKTCNNKILIPITQVEVAEKLGVSKIKVNTMFKELQRYEFLYTYKGKRGIYCLTDKAQIILKKIIQINNYLEIK